MTPMAALGRILQVVGWLWVVYGFVSPAFGLPDLSFFPGIILVFVARVLRNQAKRRDMPDLGEEAGTTEPEPTPAPRMMNTERQRVTQQERPQPVVIEQESPSEPAPQRRNELLEQIVSAGRDSAEEQMAPEPDDEAGSAQESPARAPMTSAEMIARAHERWDSKPR